jgi:hypothetical protein
VLLRDTLWNNYVAEVKAEVEKGEVRGERLQFNPEVRPWLIQDSSPQLGAI